jgi:arsenate reductase/regulatory protein spx
LLREKGAEFEEINLTKGLTVSELDKLIGKRDYRLFLNPKNELYRERGMKENPPPREEALRLMAENPNLVRRPIVVKGSQIVFGYNQEAIEGLA